MTTGIGSDEKGYGYLNKYERLFSHWEKLQIVKVIPRDVYSKIDEHEYRNAILQVLRRGIPDENAGKRRHVLSMNEIIQEVSRFLRKEKIPKSTLYHHRDILMGGDMGLIEEVDNFLEGKRHVSYYGRTARIFIGEPSGTPKDEEMYEQIRQVVLALNPDEDPERISNVLDELHEKQKETHKKALQWLEDHDEMLIKHDFDGIFLYKLITKYMNNEAGKSTQEGMMRKYLKL